MGNLFNFKDKIGNRTMNVLMTLFLEGQYVIFTESRFYFNQFCLLFDESCPSVEIQHFSLVIDTFCYTSVQFIQSAFYSYNEILWLIIFFVIKSSISVTEKWSFLRYLLINQFRKSVLRFKEFLKYLIWIVTKAISSF